MSDGRNGKNLARFAEAIALLVKQPRTPAELKEHLESRSAAQAYAYLDALYDEGLIYVSGWRKPPHGRMVPVYAWQPSVCAMQDVPQPA